jgi:nucleoside-diphosphate-sugar epimerase
MDREINFAEASLSADDTSWLVGDSSRLQELTGWQPTCSLDDSVRDMLDEA